MFQKILTRTKPIKNSSRPFGIIIVSVAGITAAVFGMFIDSIIFPIIAGLSIFILCTILILNQTALTNLKTKKGLEPEHFRLITQNMEEAVIIYSPDFKILSFNPAAEKFFKVKKDEVINQIISPSSLKSNKLKLLTQVVFPSLAPSVRQISSGGWPQVTEVSTENGFDFVTILLRTVDKNQNSTSFIKIIQDKTEQKQLLESKFGFITTLANQFQNPIKKINEIFQKIKDDVEKNSQADKETVLRGLNLSKQTLAVTNKLLEVSRLESGGYKYDFQEINLVSLIKKVINEISVIADDYNISISFNSPDEIIATVDQGKITAVTTILIENAVKYNNKGGSVNISLKENGSFAEITISDTGIGIEKEEIEKIFTKFYRTERGIQSVPNGSGLGLYIVKKIIERHGGKIWVDSIPKRGSNFHFTIPLKTLKRRGERW
jgi:two-component system sensor histidine kinase ResE